MGRPALLTSERFHRPLKNPHSQLASKHRPSTFFLDEISPSCIFHTDGIIQRCACVCVHVLSLSLGITFSWFSHVTAITSTSLLLWLNNILSHRHILFIHSSADGNLDWFYLLPITNNAAMNGGIKLFCVNIYLQFSWVYPDSRIVGSYSNSMFNFLRNCQTFPLGSCNNFPFHPATCMRFRLFRILPKLSQ